MRRRCAKPMLGLTGRLPACVYRGASSGSADRPAVVRPRVVGSQRRASGQRSAGAGGRRPDRRETDSRARPRPAPGSSQACPARPTGTRGPGTIFRPTCSSRSFPRRRERLDAAPVARQRDASSTGTAACMPPNVRRSGGMFAVAVLERGGRFGGGTGAHRRTRRWPGHRRSRRRRLVPRRDVVRRRQCRLPAARNARPAKRVGKQSRKSRRRSTGNASRRFFRYRIRESWSLAPGRCRHSVDEGTSAQAARFLRIRRPDRANWSIFSSSLR